VVVVVVEVEVDEVIMGVGDDADGLLNKRLERDSCLSLLTLRVQGEAGEKGEEEVAPNRGEFGA